MTTSQFARMPQYSTNQISHDTLYAQEEPWGQDHASSPSPLNGILPTSDYGDHEVITNGHSSFSPLTSPTDSDLPDTPGIYRTQSFDMTVFDIRKVPPEQIAAQITLIDLEIFKAIRIEEFHNCNWTKKEKQRLSPNIVSFTRRFNHTTFLVVREILNENEKARGEILTHFIKIAKKLFELNNLHSLKAVVSALQSTPIYRLTQTWKHVNKKDRSSFDKMADFLSDNENRKLLREHMDEAKLPCIPFLGLYLTDLCFLHDVPNKGPQVESTLNMIAYCQNSTYDTLIVEPHVRKYLTHVRYIDELQKFFEDDNYKLSLKYEPSKTPDLKKRHTEHTLALTPEVKTKLRTSKSHEDLLSQLEASGGMGTDSFSSDHRNSYLRRSFNTTRISSGRNSPAAAPSLPLSKLAIHKRSVPGLGELDERERRLASASVEVRKTTTLQNTLKDSTTANALLGPSGWTPSKPRSSSERGSSGGKRRVDSRAASITPSGGGASPKGMHTKSNSAGSNVLATMFGVAKGTHQDMRSDASPEPLPLTTLSLLDDSLLDDAFPFTPTSSVGNPSISGGSSHSHEDFSEGDQLCSRQSADLEDLPGYVHSWGDIIKEGILKRKNLKVNGHSVSQLLRGHTKCYVQLTTDSIIFMPKPSKKQTKPDKVMSVKLKDCRVRHRERSEKLKEEQFIIDDDDGNSTKFTAKSAAQAMEWVVAIKEALRVEEEREREEAERSLIRL